MILATICARGGSKGIPRKNLRMLYGKPLISYTYHQAYHYPAFDNIIVSTDDTEIASLFPENVVQMRPHELATDTASKWDVFRYIAECNPQYDILVDLDTGCPLRAKVDITNCIDRLKAGFDVVATAYASERNPYFNMVEVSNGHAYTVYDHITMGDYSPVPINPIVNRQSAPVVYSLSPAVFAIRRETLFKYEHWSRANMGIVEIPHNRAHDIDTLEDWDYAEYLMAKGN